MPGTKTRRWVRPWIAGGLALCLIAAGCGEDDEDETGGDGGDGGNGGTEQQGPPAAELLGPENMASGEPFRVGIPTDRGGAAIDNTEEFQAAEAALMYVNRHLGGIGGRPLEIVECDTESTPEGATACGNQFVEQEVNAVLLGVSGQGSFIAEPVIAAGIPYIAHQAASQAELTAPEGAYSLTGGPAGVFGTAAAYARDNDLGSVANLVIDVPSATGGAQALGAPAFEAAGSQLEVVGIPPGTADMTPQVSANSDADAFLIVGDPAFCLAALQAIDTLGLTDKPRLVIQQCVDPSVIEGVPGGLEGAILGTSANLDPSTEEAQLYTAVLDEFAPEDIPREGLAINGYAVVVGFARLMEGFEGEPSSDAINAQITGSTGAQLPLGGGEVELACGMSPIEILPAICSVGSFVTTLTEDGSPTEYEFLDPSELFQQG